MKQAVLVVVALSLIFGGIVFAQEQPSTVVGPVMVNRYVAPDPQDIDVQPPENVQKLMDQQVIPAAEAARLEQQVLQPVKQQ